MPPGGFLHQLLKEQFLKDKNVNEERSIPNSATYPIWMQTTGHAELVHFTAILIVACLTGEVLALGGVLDIATARGQYVKPGTNKAPVIDQEVSPLNRVPANQIRIVLGQGTVLVALPD